MPLFCQLTASGHLTSSHGVQCLKGDQRTGAVQHSPLSCSSTRCHAWDLARARSASGAPFCPVPIRCRRVSACVPRRHVKRVGDIHNLLRGELWRHSRIQIHSGKTQMWNRGGFELVTLHCLKLYAWRTGGEALVRRFGRSSGRPIVARPHSHCAGQSASVLMLQLDPPPPSSPSLPPSLPPGYGRLWPIQFWPIHFCPAIWPANFGQN